MIIPIDDEKLTRWIEELRAKEHEDMEALRAKHEKHRKWIRKQIYVDKLIGFITILLLAVIAADTL